MVRLFRPAPEHGVCDSSSPCTLWGQVLKGGFPIKESGLCSKAVSALKGFKEGLVVTRFAVVLRKQWSVEMHSNKRSGLQGLTRVLNLPLCELFKLS